MRVLLVEDEVHLLEALEEVLKKNNYTVDTTKDGIAGLDYALSNIYDVIVLDVMLPKKNGIEVLKEIREGKVSTPILLLTAKSELEDKILGLDSGADDYLTKPFKTEELLARLRALARRKEEYLPGGILKFNDIELDPNSLILYCQNKSYKLTLKESQLLELLISMNEMVLSKASIIEKLWGFDGEGNDNHVEVYISFLRKKLNALEAKASIQTIRGVGYTLKK